MRTTHHSKDHVWVNFVETELLLARTFCSLAESEGLPGRLRCTGHARAAYDRATHFMLKARMSNAEFASFSVNLEEVKLALETLESR